VHRRVFLKGTLTSLILPVWGRAVLAQDAPADPLALVAAARAQIGVTVIYDPAYAALDFPGGDPDRSRGVCTDVVIRAMRDAWGIDLQRAVNRDMTAAFGSYPAIWGLTATDRNIDHRRVPNLQTLFARVGAELAGSASGPQLQPGDLMSWTLPGNLPHIGILSDRSSSDGLRPLIIHNIGRGTQEEDIADLYDRTGHYRFGAEALARLRALDRA
jgi:hypothetical protein